MTDGERIAALEAAVAALTARVVRLEPLAAVPAEKPTKGETGAAVTGALARVKLRSGVVHRFTDDDEL